MLLCWEVLRGWMYLTRHEWTLKESSIADRSEVAELVLVLQVSNILDSADQMLRVCR